VLGLEALCFGNAWYVVLSRLGAVASSAEDLKIVRFICPAEGYGENVVDIPSLSGGYFYIAASARAISLQK